MDRKVKLLEKIPHALDVRVKLWSENESIFCVYLEGCLYNLKLHSILVSKLHFA